MSGWATLRQSLRTLESQTESQFHTLSQFTTTPKLPESPSSEETQCSSTISTLLDSRETLIAQLSRLLDSEPQSTTQLKQTNLTRHRDLLTEHRSEHRRLLAQITQARDRQHLLSHVRADIAASRSDAQDEESEYMLRERGQIDRSHTVIDGIIAQAYSINENFGVQRETLASVNRRIKVAAGTLPGVNELMGRIGNKKRRDGVILAGFIAFCFILFFWIF
ncbi:hypothetical protein BT93_L5151 [Corymbia citriodora subsp. variegata]|uniref:Golgi SNAP receptor complex member 1 n=1 Tax=Corymbia citriodora subsp. variegata TaxID=360336 RepID=A0A8T0CF89_CORYI|nr:hypothetical protein BT93_L5151 [Corymbia citriodora subsp. variegata]